MRNNDLNPIDYSLYLVTDQKLYPGRLLEEVVEEAVKGGVTVVQLREKNATSKEFYTMALKLKKILLSYKVPLIINDRLDIALACDADGIHIGQNDLPYPIVREIIGKDKIIGLSVENTEDAIKAEALDVNYIAVSPVFNTPTKQDTANSLGIEGLEKIKSLSRHPVLAIGGINKDNATEIIKTGADGICVVSAIMSAKNPEKAAYELKSLFPKK